MTFESFSKTSLFEQIGHSFVSVIQDNGSDNMNKSVHITNQLCM